MTTKKNISIALAAVILGQMTLPVVAQESNVLTRTIDRLPVNAGGKAANDATGEQTFQTTVNNGTDAGVDAAAVVVFSEDDIAKAIENSADAAVSADDTAEVISEEEHMQDRIYEVDGDPITNAATMLLDDSGVIGRQRAVAESIMMMDEQIKHQRKIEEALTALGPDTPIEVSPGVFKTFDDTPAAIRARIAYIKLQQQLAETLNSGATVDTTGGVDPMQNEIASLPVRDDGTGYQDPDSEVSEAVTEDTPDVEGRLGTLLQKAEARLAQREAEILDAVEAAKRAAEEEAAAEAEAVAEEAGSLDQVSVREIYGSHGVFTSVIDVSGNRQVIKIGDRIVNGYTVKRIASDFVEVTKDGQSTRLSL